MSTAVSVVMAVWNGQAYLPAQLDSVIRQLRPGDELVVVDDASTDDSPAILSRVDPAILRMVRNESNRGVRLSFERGLRLASHDVIFLCDQDDVWLAGKRDAFVLAFDADPDIKVVISDAKLIDAKGTVIAESFMSGRRGFRAGVPAVLWRNRYLGCAMALRRSLLHDALPIPSIAPMHDMWLGAIASLTGRVVYLPQPYLLYRRHSSNVSPQHSQPWPQMLVWRLSFAFAILRRVAALAVARLRANS